MSNFDTMWIEKSEDVVGLVIICVAFILSTYNFYKFILRDGGKEWKDLVRRYCEKVRLPFDEDSFMYKPFFIKLSAIMWLIVSGIFLIAIINKVFF